MLNELYTLERSLVHFQVEVEESHPWVKRLGRGDLLIAGIDADGLVIADPNQQMWLPPLHQIQVTQGAAAHRAASVDDHTTQAVAPENPTRLLNPSCR